MDFIEINNLEIFAYHGVERKEKVEGQTFYIDAKLYCDMSKSAKTDRLDDTVNYARVCEFINSYFKNNRYDLIEAAASRTADELLKKMPKIRGIELTVNKPNAPIGLPFKNVSVTIEKKWRKAYLSIGSNMGDKEAYLNYAVDSLYNEGCCRVLAVSNYVETQPYGPVEQENFLNGCIEIETLFSPHELLDYVNRVEREAGRARTVHWGPRTLDIDIVLFEEEVVYDNRLIIPHKEMHKREFVLVPLVQIAPYAMNKVLNKSAMQLLEELSGDGKCQSAGKCDGCSGCSVK